MSSFRAATLAALVVFATVFAVPLAGAIALTDAAATGAQQDGTNATDANATDGNATDEPSFGAQVSSFMQTSSTSATSEVENGMFEAEYETADNRTAVVDRRADRIERRIDRLRDRKRDLAEREGELNEVAYTARMSRIVSEIESLERQINGTETKARASGADADRFDRLRANVSELRGPKVDAVADAIPGRGPPADRGAGERGPPDDAGPGDDTPGNGPPGAGAPDNASAGGGDHPGNGRGPSGDDGPGNGGGDEAPGNGPGDGGAGGNGDDGNPGDGAGDGSSGNGNPGNGPGAVLDDGLPFVTLVWS